MFEDIVIDLTIYIRKKIALKVLHTRIQCITHLYVIFYRTQMKIFNSLSNKLYAFVISISLFFFVSVTLPRIFGNHKEWYAIHKNNHTSFGYVNTLTKVIGNNCTLALHKLFDKITVFVYNSCIYEKKNILNNILRPGFENIRSVFIQLPCVEVTEHFFFFFYSVVITLRFTLFVP